MVKCRKCGTRLTANTLNNCPNCGPAEPKGIWRFLRGVFSLVVSIHDLALVILFILFLVGLGFLLNHLFGH